MKKLLYIILLLISYQSFGQVKGVAILSEPTYVGDASTGYVPIVIGGVNRKTLASNFALGKLDSVTFSGGNLFGWKNGSSTLIANLPGGTSPVTSVFGRTGVVVAVSGDYSAFYYPLGSNPAGYLSSVDTTNITNFFVKVRSLFTAGAGLTFANGQFVNTITNNNQLSNGSGYLTNSTGDARYAALSHTHTLSQITQSGATTNQIPQWNGSSWVPVTFAGGITYSAGWGLLLSSTTFSVDTVNVTSKAAKQKSLDSLQALTCAACVGYGLFAPNDSTIAADTTKMIPWTDTASFTGIASKAWVRSQNFGSGSGGGDAFLSHNQNFTGIDSFTNAAFYLPNIPYNANTTKTKVVIEDTTTGKVSHQTAAYIDMTGALVNGHAQWNGTNFVVDNTVYLSSAPNTQLIYGTGTSTGSSSNLTFGSGVFTLTSNDYTQVNNSTSTTNATFWFHSDKAILDVTNPTAVTGSEYLGTNAFIRLTYGSSDFGNLGGTATYNRMTFDNSGINILSQAPYGNKISINAGTVSFSGGMVYNRTTVADVAYTMLFSDYIIAYTSLTATRAVTPPASPVTNQVWIIKNETSNTSAITFVGTLDGAVNPTMINTAYGVKKIYYNGSAWFSTQ